MWNNFASPPYQGGVWPARSALQSEAGGGGCRGQLANLQSSVHSFVYTSLYNYPHIHILIHRVIHKKRAP